MVRVFPQFLAADGDEIVHVQGLAVDVGRPEEVLLLSLVTCHHLGLGLRQVRQVPLDVGARTILQHCLLLLLDIVLMAVASVQFAHEQFSVLGELGASVHANWLRCAIVFWFRVLDLPRRLRLRVGL